MNRPIDNDPNPPDQIEAGAIEEYLRGNSPVSQQYRALPEEAVPSHLDAMILARARDALADNDQAQRSAPVTDELTRVRDRRRRLTQWAIPTALAACSLVVVSIVIRSGTQHEVSSADMMKAEQPAPPPQPQVAARPEQSAEAEDTQGLVLIAPPRDAVTEFSSLAPAPAPAPAVDNARVASERQMLERSTAARREQERRAAAMAQRQEPAPVAESVAAAATPPAAPAAAAPLAEQKRMAAPPERQSNELRTPEELDEIAVTGGRAAPQTARSGPRGTVGGASAGMSEQQWEMEQMRADPERWLEHIRELRRDLQPVAADREWQAFRKRYPDYNVEKTDLARGK